MKRSHVDRRTVPELPRKAWSSHPNYPQQILLLGSHENFRRVSRALIDGERDGASPAWVYALFNRWIAAMRSHERYEETKLYPYLAHRFEVSFNSASAGHDELHRCDDAVRTAIRGARDAGDRRQVAEALESHDAALRRHLDHEEELVIPLLLALPPDEFQSYASLSIEELLARPHSSSQL